MTKRFGTPGPRALDPELCLDHRLAACSLSAQLLYDRLVVQADDQGRLQGRPHVVRACCFPLMKNLTDAEVLAWLRELEVAGLVRVYEAAETTLVQVSDWWRDQAGMRRAYPSRWPAPPEWTDNSYGIPADQRPGTRARDGENESSAGKVRQSAANRPEITAPAYAGAYAGASFASRPTEGGTEESADAATSNHKAFVAFWCAEFAQVTGVPYAFQGGKDGAHVKAILELAKDDLVLAQARALTLLKSDDPFYLGKGVDLGLLRAQWNRLGSPGRAASSGGGQPRAAAYERFIPPDPQA